MIQKLSTVCGYFYIGYTPDKGEYIRVRSNLLGALRANQTYARMKMKKDAGTDPTETRNESGAEKEKLTLLNKLMILAALAIVSIPIFGIEF